ncbi:MAG: CpaE family protein [Beutenbergiaceae bacterium]
MSAGVLVVLRGERELALVGAIEASPTLTVVRRCADSAELLAAALAGLGSVAVLDAEVDPDRSLVARLAASGVRTVILCGSAEVARFASMGALALEDASPVDQVVRTMAEAAQLPPTVEDTAEIALPQPVPDRAPGSMLAVWGPHGSPGRTTIALNMASELAAASYRTLIIDADIWGAAVASCLGLISESAGLAAAVRAADQGTLTSEKLARLCLPVTDHLLVLPGLPRPARWREVSGVGIDEVWAQARQLADWVVVDLPTWVPEDEGGGLAMGPQRNDIHLSAMAQADCNVAVGAAEPVAIQRLVSALLDAEERGAATGARRVVVNRIRSEAAGPRPVESVREALHRFAGIAGIDTVPDDRSACDRAALVGASLTEIAPRSPAREAILAIAQEVVGQPRRRWRRRWRRSQR